MLFYSESKYFFISLRKIVKPGFPSLNLGSVLNFLKNFIFSFFFAYTSSQFRYLKIFGLSLDSSLPVFSYLQIWLSHTL